MSSLDPNNDAIAEQVNDLYWNSSRTVDEIIGQIGVTRNTLYSSIQPVPAGANCTSCGDRLVFTNRTNRSSGSATCRQCGQERNMDDEDLAAAASQAGGVDGGGAVGYEDDHGRRRWRGEIGDVPTERVALIGGAAALGILVGAAAARAMRG